MPLLNSHSSKPPNSSEKNPLAIENFVTENVLTVKSYFSQITGGTRYIFKFIGFFAFFERKVSIRC